jgi:hypothetical protein
MDKIFNENKVDVTNFFQTGRSILVKTRKEAIEMTKDKGYFYEVFSKDEFLGYGVTK